MAFAPVEAPASYYEPDPRTPEQLRVDLGRLQYQVLQIERALASATGWSTLRPALDQVRAIRAHYRGGGEIAPWHGRLLLTEVGRVEWLGSDVDRWLAQPRDWQTAKTVLVECRRIIQKARTLEGTDWWKGTLPRD